VKRYKASFEFDEGTDKDADDMIILKIILSLENIINHKGTFKIEEIKQGGDVENKT
jgi:hypothetical protein